MDLPGLRNTIGNLGDFAAIIHSPLIVLFKFNYTISNFGDLLKSEQPK